MSCIASSEGLGSATPSESSYQSQLYHYGYYLKKEHYRLLDRLSSLEKEISAVCFAA